MTGPVVVGAAGGGAAAALDFGRALARALDVEVVPVRAAGDPVDALRAAAHESGAGFIVVAPRRRGRLARALLRGTSARLAAASPCPVVAVSPGGRIEPVRLLDGAPIVVGSDGTPSAARALVVADSLSVQLDLPVLPVGIDIADQAAAGTLRYRNVHRYPGDALAEVARRARSAMLVIGSGRGGRSSAPVAQRLLAAAPVPLVVVPGPHGDA